LVDRPLNASRAMSAPCRHGKGTYHATRLCALLLKRLASDPSGWQLHRWREPDGLKKRVTSLEGSSNCLMQRSRNSVSAVAGSPNASPTVLKTRRFRVL